LPLDGPDVGLVQLTNPLVASIPTGTLSFGIACRCVCVYSLTKVIAVIVLQALRTVHEPGSENCCAVEGSVVVNARSESDGVEEWVDVLTTGMEDVG
jgi:hypothetical protein